MLRNFLTQVAKYSEEAQVFELFFHFLIALLLLAHRLLFSTLVVTAAELSASFWCNNWGHYRVTKGILCWELSLFSLTHKLKKHKLNINHLKLLSLLKGKLCTPLLSKCREMENTGKKCKGVDRWITLCMCLYNMQAINKLLISGFVLWFVIC